MDGQTAETLLKTSGFDVTPARLNKLAQVPDTARLVKCGDESTGERFGKAKCRVGRCRKIGRSWCWQIWAVWA